MFASIFGLAGCGGGGDSSDGLDTDIAASGFTGSADAGPGDAGSADDDAGASSKGGGTEGDSGGGSGYDTLGEGDLRGILTFTLYPADAQTGQDILGMAGAWRHADDGVDGLDDFFALYALETNFPGPPTEVDTLEHNDIPAGFQWGAPGDWLLAGNGMKLVRDETEALACLLYLGDPPTLELPDGTQVSNYPVYASTYSELQPAGCAPDPSTWLPDASYDIVLYGGDVFDTNALVDQVHTPPAFDVTAPDIAEFQLPVDRASDLEITWTGQGNPDNRIVIRVWDVFGRMFTIHAADDGSYTIPADDLGRLDVGPATLTVARENVEDVPFTDGTVRVVSRYEHWGYLDLY